MAHIQPKLWLKMFLQTFFACATEVELQEPQQLQELQQRRRRTTTMMMRKGKGKVLFRLPDLNRRNKIVSRTNEPAN